MTRMRAALLLCAVCCVSLEAGEDATRARRVAATRSGSVVGAVDARGGARWLGVPYAAPPIRALRFRPPAPPAPWSTPLDCSRRVRHVCPQAQVVRGVVLGDEDCLFLNVFSPPPARELAPVMVFLHGGAYAIGDDSEAGLYDGAALAANASVVVVTLNYRLGVLGFLAHPSLQVGGVETSNNGLLDQRAAMRWVRDNIAGFGGDAERITLFGQSAGAMSACAHVASPASTGLFRAAILESGNCDSPLLWSPLQAALQQGRAFAADHGCPQDGEAAAACLRNASVASLLAHELTPSGAPMAPLLAWVPVVDAIPDGLLELPLAALPRARRVPVIIGTVKDEGTMFAAMAPAVMGDAPLPLSEQQLGQLLNRVYNASIVSTVLQRYADGTPTARLAAILRDALFVCPARRAAAALISSGGRAFLYHFDHELRWPESRLLGLGTYHASELPFVFRHHGAHIFDADDLRVEALFSRLWGAFAHDADVAAAAPPLWPAFSTRGEAMLLDAQPHVQVHLWDKTCELWDGVSTQTDADLSASQ